MAKQCLTCSTHIPRPFSPEEDKFCSIKCCAVLDRSLLVNYCSQCEGFEFQKNQVEGICSTCHFQNEKKRDDQLRLNGKPTMTFTLADKFKGLKL